MSGAARARLFVALDLPEDAREALAAWGGEVAAPDGAERRLRLIPADALHVTLCFLGWRDEGQSEDGARAGGRGELSAPAPLRFPGAAVTLYRSRLSRAGAHYEPLARAELG